MTDNPPAGQEQAPQPKIDTNIPQTARIWNYFLGGLDNYPVDRAVGDQIMAEFPGMVVLARAARDFLVRAVRHLAGEAGIRQFLDVGTGLPTANNTHEVAQSVAPESRIVYVDNDPLVLVHARALLTSDPLGATDYVDADARDTSTILAEAARTLDLDRPVALVLSGILAHLPTYEDAVAMVRQLMDGLAPGSYLVVSDSLDTTEDVVEAARIWNQSANPPYELRNPEQFTGYFDGLELVEPGVVPAPHWRPDPDGPGPTPSESHVGVARKP